MPQAADGVLCHRAGELPGLRGALSHVLGREHPLLDLTRHRERDQSIVEAVVGEGSLVQADAEDTKHQLGPLGGHAVAVGPIIPVQSPLFGESAAELGPRIHLGTADVPGRIQMLPGEIEAASDILERRIRVEQHEIEGCFHAVRET